jgi:hypothetical protein
MPSEAILRHRERFRTKTVDYRVLLTCESILSLRYENKLDNHYHKDLPLEIIFKSQVLSDQHCLSVLLYHVKVI